MGLPEFETNMEILRKNCSFIWVALSTSSLLDLKTVSFKIPRGELEPSVARCGYNLTILTKIMRNSSRISEASTADNVQYYVWCPLRKFSEEAVKQGIMHKSNIIQPGSPGSTVIGEKPTWYLFNEPSIEKLANCVNEHLNVKKYERSVILCDRGISPRHVKPHLKGDIIFYEGGVEMFDKNDIDEPYPEQCESFYRPQFSQSDAADLAKQREDLERWLEQGGTLLTHERMFRGAESEAVILLSKQWSELRCQRRDPLIRAVSDLCLVTGNLNINYDNARKYFNVERVDHDQDPVYPEIESIDYISILENGIETLELRPQYGNIANRPLDRSIYGEKYVVRLSYSNYTNPTITRGNLKLPRT